jgi:mannitol-1-/sugar-/sorbitol-6-phosphatase
MISLPCRGVLFDCDGVLVDSVASVQSAWTRWATEQGFDPAVVLADIHGRRSIDTVAKFVAEADRAAAAQRVEQFEIEDAGSIRPIPGALELTANLPPDRWAVVTSGTAALASARLTAAGFGSPPVVITADDVHMGKPDPEGYALAAQRLGVPAGETVVFEDALNGVRAARAAGVGAVLGVGAADLADEADFVVADLRSARWTANILYLPY